MQKQTKNHPLAAVQSRISPNLLKNKPQKEIENSYLAG